ncbi:tyrosine-type recombinase/integrase [Novosphingobium sp. MW5]|nr:tyrosine-type recombinase/integrase [Novosphingobium sp. MW5]
MARRINLLTALDVRRINKPGRHSDGNCLYLYVGEGGGRSWLLIYKWKARRVELGLGPVHAVTLAQAREKAREAATLRAQGIDPKTHWRAQGVQKKTFGEVAIELIEDRKPGWKNAKHSAQWSSTLKTYAKPIWSKSVDDVTVDDVLGILRPIWTAKAETAKRVRGRIEAVLAAAKVRGLRSGENPASWRDNLKLLLPSRPASTHRHHMSMHYDRIRGFMRDLIRQEGNGARALEFLIHTATRTNEVLNMQWSSLDLDEKVWTIAAHGMKAGREHRVPLSSAAMELLKSMPRCASYVFPAADPAKPLSNMTMAAVLKRMGLQNEATVHGFRSSFRDWVWEKTEFSRELAEEALAHSVSKVERAYRRGDALERRREVMETWSRYIAGLGPLGHG